MNKKPKKSARSKHSIRNILSTILLLTALGVLFYPIVANYLASQQAVKSVQNFNSELSKTSKSKITEMLDQAKLYNARLYNEYVYDMSQHIPWSGKIPDYNSTLNIDKSGMMGYISIPQITVNDVPIYHGDAESTLAIGVGHLSQTSLPIGGTNTHTVLAAHSGRVNDTLFSDLDKLKKDDVFYLHTLNLDLKYEVINIKVVNPSDVSTLGIIKGEDLATLVTCYPTGINNERLLVTGKRIALSKITPTERINRNQFGYPFWVFLISIFLALLGIGALLLWILRKRAPFYRATLTASTHLTLSKDARDGEFGFGIYLTSSKKLAKYQAQALGEGAVINYYRFQREKKELKYLIYHQKTENWRKFVQQQVANTYEGREHDYVKGPHDQTAVRIGRAHRQLVVQSEQALEHLTYLRSYPLPTKESQKKRRKNGKEEK
ncbi:class C sortase [Lactococcus termiticola]|uniref:Sortase n=1 Tax=Lactococcus termiticola TaxID=2169526 RepID=A0A2R5HI71_9LACT|nr:class C sortase [Lactococcus termiticola]GBG95958.1 sortase [Lactococcus termiticola]